MLSLYAYLAGGKLYGYSFCEKPIFSYNKGIDFNLTIIVVEQHWEGFSNSIPIKVINIPTVLIKNDEIHVITQILDTQELSITGDTANHD